MPCVFLWLCVPSCLWHHFVAVIFDCLKSDEIVMDLKLQFMKIVSSIHEVFLYVFNASGVYLPSI